jgi:hypothetical protein
VSYCLFTYLKKQNFVILWYFRFSRWRVWSRHTMSPFPRRPFLCNVVPRYSYRNFWLILYRTIFHKSRFQLQWIHLFFTCVVSEDIFVFCCSGSFRWRITNSVLSICCLRGKGGERASETGIVQWLTSCRWVKDPDRLSPPSARPARGGERRMGAD